MVHNLIDQIEAGSYVCVTTSDPGVDPVACQIHLLALLMEVRLCELCTLRRENEYQYFFSYRLHGVRLYLSGWAYITKLHF